MHPMDIGLPELTIVLVLILLLFGSALWLRVRRGVAKKKHKPDIVSGRRKK
jgi:hypothetical protein